MGRVSLDINGRKYAMGCEDGEEERLFRLGQKLDDRVNQIANQFGQIGDLKLLVMAGITLMDGSKTRQKILKNALMHRRQAYVKS